MGGALPGRTTWAQWPELAGLRDSLDFGEVVVVLVFGSVARGDPDERSDLDVLVVVADGTARTAVRTRLRAAPRPGVVPLLFTPEGLVQELAERPSFVAHLLDEGIVVAEGPGWDALRAQLAQSASDPALLAREVRSRALDLNPLAHADRFRTSPVTALSHLYGISRSLVIARLLQVGIHEYGWRRAFDRFAEVRPDLRPELEALKALRPYYEYARARTGAELPERKVSTDEVRALVRAAGHLAA